VSKKPTQKKHGLLAGISDEVLSTPLSEAELGDLFGTLFKQGLDTAEIHFRSPPCGNGCSRANKPEARTERKQNESPPTEAIGAGS
jgi:hypothetical protein